MTLATGELGQPRVARRRPRWPGPLVVAVLLVGVAGTAGIVLAQRRSTVEDLRTLLVPRPSSATDRPSNGTYVAKHGIAVLVGTSPRDSSDALDRTLALAQRQYELLP